MLQACNLPAIDILPHEVVRCSRVRYPDWNPSDRDSFVASSASEKFSVIAYAGNSSRGDPPIETSILAIKDVRLVKKSGNFVAVVQKRQINVSCVHSN